MTADTRLNLHDERAIKYGDVLASGTKRDALRASIVYFDERVVGRSTTADVAEALQKMRERLRGRREAAAHTEQPKGLLELIRVWSSSSYDSVRDSTATVPGTFALISNTVRAGFGGSTFLQPNRGDVTPDFEMAPAEIDYVPVPPHRTYKSNMVFKRRGRQEPIPFDLPDEG